MVCGSYVLCNEETIFEKNVEFYPPDLLLAMLPFICHRYYRDLAGRCTILKFNAGLLFAEL